MKITIPKFYTILKNLFNNIELMADAQLDIYAIEQPHEKSSCNIIIMNVLKLQHVKADETQ